MSNKTNTVRAILLDATECDRPEADNPDTIEISAADLQLILERHIKEPAQCLHQIAEPAAIHPDDAAVDVRNRLSYLRAACRYAWKHHGLGDNNPAERISMPKVRNERHVYLGREEFLKICSRIKPGGSRAAIRIAFYSGMRASEVENAQVAYGGSVFELASEMTKNSMPRAVPIHPRIAHIVRNPSLWPIKPTKWTVSKAFKAAERITGFGYARLHDLRHSTASEMINAGVDLYTVGGVLGHKSTVSTKRYSHLATRTLQDAVSLVGKNHRTQAKKGKG